MSIKQIHIEKYDIGSFEKEGKPYVMIRTEIIQKMMMKHAQEFLLWIYLESLPITWKPCKEHLTKHFNISERTYERYMSWLSGAGLIEYRQARGPKGYFGKGHLVILDGSKFNMNSTTNGTVRIGETLINKKKTKVIHRETPNGIAKFGVPDEFATDRSSKGPQKIHPERQITEVPSNDVHINTIIKEIKERKKTNKPSCSVFSDTSSVKTHLESIISNRNIFVEEDIINQIVFYVGIGISFNDGLKKMNIALKKVREGLWNIPNGYKNITYKSIGIKEDQERKEKIKMYQEESIAFRSLTKTIREGEGIKGFSSLVKKLRDDLDDNRGRMQEQIVSTRDKTRSIA